MSAPERILLYDGQCAVCNRTVAWLLDHDPEGRLHYAPLQGPTAAQILDRHPEVPPDLDSLIYVAGAHAAHEHLSWYSSGVLDAVAELAGGIRWLRVLRWVPRPLRDVAYRAFAALRYRLFGEATACRVPRPEEIDRFLP